MAQSDSHQTAPATHALAAYRTEQVTNLSQKELILMLYDGAIKFCGEGKAAIAEGDLNASYHVLVRAREVVTELLSILNTAVEGEVVDNLERLYEFCILSITEVNFTKETALLDGVIAVLTNLRSAWAEVDFDAALAELEGGGAPVTPVEALPSPDPQLHPDPTTISPAQESETSSGLTLTA